MKKITMLLAIPLLLILVGGCDYLTEKTFLDIDGTVEPKIEGIKVELTKQGRLIAQTTTKPGGLYTIDNVEPGKYGLFFTYENKIYSYNNTIGKLYDKDNNFIYGNLELIKISESNKKFDVNLNKIFPLFLSDRIVVVFNNNVSKKEINQLASEKGYTITEKDGQNTFNVFVPEDNIIFEVMKDFDRYPEVNITGPSSIFVLSN